MFCFFDYSTKSTRVIQPLYEPTEKLNKFTANAEKTLSDIKDEFRNFLSTTNAYTVELNDKLAQPVKTYRSVSIQAIPIEETCKESISCQCDDSTLNIVKVTMETASGPNELKTLEEKSTQKDDFITMVNDATTNTDLIETKETVSRAVDAKPFRDCKRALTQQNMPPVHIPKSLVIQKTLDLEIKPCRKESRPFNENISYKEYQHELPFVEETAETSNKAEKVEDQHTTERRTTFNEIVSSCEVRAERISNEVPITHGTILSRESLDDSDISVLAIIEDGRPMKDIITSSLMILKKSQPPSPEESVADPKDDEDIIQIIKDGKRTVPSFHQFKHTKRPNNEHRRKSSTFQELDHMLKNKIDLMRDTFAVFKPKPNDSSSKENDSDEKPQKLTKVTSSTYNELVKLSLGGEEKPPKIDLGFLRKPTPPQPEIPPTPHVDPLLFDSPSQEQIVINERKSESSFVLGRDAWTQCSLDSKENSFIAIENHQINENQSTQIEQLSKSIQTSSSASLALMFNEKLIEKIKSQNLSMIPQPQPENCNEQCLFPRRDYDQNIDLYKKPNNNKERKKRKMLRNASKFEENQRKHQTRCKSISLDTNLTSTSTYSDGEIKCKCCTSVGEIHVCSTKQSNSIKSNVQYLKNHSDRFMQYEQADNTVQVLRKRAFNDNWHTYYVTSSSSSP